MVTVTWMWLILMSPGKYCLRFYCSYKWINIVTETLITMLTWVQYCLYSHLPVIILGSWHVIKGVQKFLKCFIHEYSILDNVEALSFWQTSLNSVLYTSSWTWNENGNITREKTVKRLTHLSLLDSSVLINSAHFSMKGCVDGRTVLCTAAMETFRWGAEGTSL